MKHDKYLVERQRQLQQCRELLHEYGLKNHPPAPQLAADLEGVRAENERLRGRILELRDRVERLEVELQRSANSREGLQQQVDQLKRANSLLWKAVERAKAQIRTVRVTL